jgi:hypothetical protein
MNPTLTQRRRQGAALLLLTYALGWALGRARGREEAVTTILRGISARTSDP